VPADVREAMAGLLCAHDQCSLLCYSCYRLLLLLPAACCLLLAAAILVVTSLWRHSFSSEHA